jgi:hypothetical protein
MEGYFNIAGIVVKLELQDEFFFNERLKNYVSNNTDYQMHISAVINNNISDEVGEIETQSLTSKKIRISPTKYILIHYKKYPFIADKLIVDYSKSEIFIEYIDHYNKYYTVQEREYVLVGNAFFSLISKFGFVRFHSSCIKYNDDALLFLADSGTGKSTHTNLWKELYPTKVTYINDDKALLKISGDYVLAYGCPWSGKSALNNNICAPVKAIVVLARGVENKISEITFQDQTKTILKNIALFPDSILAIEEVYKNYNAVFKKVKLFSLECNISIDVVKVVEECIYQTN